jgi:hypothetical protein
MANIVRVALVAEVAFALASSGPGGSGGAGSAATVGPSGGSAASLDAVRHTAELALRSEAELKAALAQVLSTVDPGTELPGTALLALGRLSASDSHVDRVWAERLPDSRGAWQRLRKFTGTGLAAPSPPCPDSTALLEELAQAVHIGKTPGKDALLKWMTDAYARVGKSDNCGSEKEGLAKQLVEQEARVVSLETELARVTDAARVAAEQSRLATQARKVCEDQAAVIKTILGMKAEDSEVVRQLNGRLGDAATKLDHAKDLHDACIQSVKENTKLLDKAKNECQDCAGKVAAAKAVEDATVLGQLRTLHADVVGNDANVDATAYQLAEAIKSRCNDNVAAHKTLLDVRQQRDALLKATATFLKASSQEVDKGTLRQIRAELLTLAGFANADARDMSMQDVIAAIGRRTQAATSVSGTAECERKLTIAENAASSIKAAEDRAAAAEVRAAKAEVRVAEAERSAAEAHLLKDAAEAERSVAEAHSLKDAAEVRAAAVNERAAAAQDRDQAAQDRHQADKERAAADKEHAADRAAAAVATTRAGAAEAQLLAARTALALTEGDNLADAITRLKTLAPVSAAAAVDSSTPDPQAKLRSTAPDPLRAVLERLGVPMVEDGIPVTMLEAYAEQIHIEREDFTGWSTQPFDGDLHATLTGFASSVLETLGLKRLSADALETVLDTALGKLSSPATTAANADDETELTRILASIGELVVLPEATDALGGGGKGCKEAVPKMKVVLTFLKTLKTSYGQLIQNRMKLTLKNKWKLSATNVTDIFDTVPFVELSKSSARQKGTDVVDVQAPIKNYINRYETAEKLINKAWDDSFNSDPAFAYKLSVLIGVAAGVCEMLSPGDKRKATTNQDQVAQKVIEFVNSWKTSSDVPGDLGVQMRMLHGSTAATIKDAAVSLFAIASKIAFWILTKQNNQGPVTTTTLDVDEVTAALEKAYSVLVVSSFRKVDVLTQAEDAFIEHVKLADKIRGTYETALADLIVERTKLKEQLAQREHDRTFDRAEDLRRLTDERSTRESQLAGRAEQLKTLRTKLVDSAKDLNDSLKVHVSTLEPYSTLKRACREFARKAGTSSLLLTGQLVMHVSAKNLTVVYTNPVKTQQFTTASAQRGHFAASGPFVVFKTLKQVFRVSSEGSSEVSNAVVTSQVLTVDAQGTVLTVSGNRATLHIASGQWPHKWQKQELPANVATGQAPANDAKKGLVARFLGLGIWGSPKVPVSASASVAPINTTEPLGGAFCKAGDMYSVLVAYANGICYCRVNKDESYWVDLERHAPSDAVVRACGFVCSTTGKISVGFAVYETGIMLVEYAEDVAQPIASVTVYDTMKVNSCDIAACDGHFVLAFTVERVVHVVRFDTLEEAYNKQWTALKSKACSDVEGSGPLLAVCINVGKDRCYEGVTVAASSRTCFLPWYELEPLSTVLTAVRDFAQGVGVSVETFKDGLAQLDITDEDAGDNSMGGGASAHELVAYAAPARRASFAQVPQSSALLLDLLRG